MRMAVPGESLWELARQGQITRPMVEAAGSEFHRAHQRWNRYLGGLWSHGNAGMENVIYDGASGRARLVDFELVHDRNLDARERQADDLVAFLIDLARLSSDEQWADWAIAFLRAYGGDRRVIAEVRRGLVAPRGLARIWWGVRAGFQGRRIRVRLENLRNALTQELAALDELPDEQAGDTEKKFADATDQGGLQGSGSGNAQEAANEDKAALAKAKGAWDEREGEDALDEAVGAGKGREGPGEEGKRAKSIDRVKARHGRDWDED